MSTIFIVSFIAFLICPFIGVFVYYHSGKRIEHALFLAFCLVNTWMALSDFLLAQSNIPATAVIWARTGIAPGVAVSFALHFVLVVSGWKGARNKPLLALMYLPNFLYYLYVVFSGDIVEGVVSGPWGYEPKFGRNAVLASVSGAWIGIMGLLCIVIPMILFFRVKDGRRKKQALYMAMGFFFPTVLGSVSALLKPWAGIEIPRLPSAFTLIQEMVLGYAVWRYGLLDLSPARAAKNIIETVSDALIIVDREWNIASHNFALVPLSEYGERELAGKDVRELFPETALTSHPGKSGNGGVNAVGRIEGILLSRSGRRVSVDVSVSELHEPDGAKAGYVLVARDVSDKKKAEAEKEKLIDELRAALENVKTLSGLIPICARCKKVRDDQGLWNQIESYVSEHSDALFSHGLCPDCVQKLYGKEAWYKPPD